MRRSEALTRTLHSHAIVLHRISCLLAAGEHLEAHERMDYLEALCRDTLDTIEEMRSTDGFTESVLADIAALPSA